MNQPIGITILGLGPGSPDLLTREAWDVLQGTAELYLRTSQHPTVKSLPGHLKIHSFDHLYQQYETFEQVYEQIVAQVLELGKRTQGVVYAVPGHPFIAEATTPEIMRRSADAGILVRIVEGISFLGPVYTALQADPLPQSSIVDAFELVTTHVPPFPPDKPALIAQIHSPHIASEVKLTLMEVYPDEHSVKLVHGAGAGSARVESLKLYEIDRSQSIGLLTTLYVPPLGAGTSFEAFQEVIAHLRAPDGCPWDREQTHQSLRPHLLEEAYETLTALDEGSPGEMSEEFGDLLLQIVLHAQIAREEGEFTMADVIQGIHDKLIRRHPHVFGDVKVAGADQVLSNWERLKEAERGGEGKPQKGLLDGVALTLPALVQAQTYQQRVARVGFEWPDLHRVINRVVEKFDEARMAEDEEERIVDVGDLLFAIVHLARWYGVDAESSLREANARYRLKVAYLENAARKQNRSISDLSKDEMEAFWREVKHKAE